MTSDSDRSRSDLIEELVSVRSKLAHDRIESLRDVFENMLEEIRVVDAKTRKFVHVNKSARRNLGYSSAELQLMTPLDISPGINRESLEVIIEPLLSGERQLVKIETVQLRKNGSLYPAEIQLQMLRAQDSMLFVATVQDISERRSAQEERHKLEEQLRQAQKMETVGTLAGGVAHDFNNILSPIIGYADLLREQLAEGSQAWQDLKHIETAAWRAKDLVEQLLAFSCQSEKDRKPVKIGMIIKEGLKLLRASLPNSIEIKRDLCDEPGLVLADPIQIHQVLMNLCTNASHAMKEDGGTLSITLALGECDFDGDVHSEAKEALTLSVSDTGHGMDSLTLKRIFEPFYTTKRTDEGTGLGMSVVHGFIKSHGGKIEVESELGQGSTFRIHLPIIMVDGDSKIENSHSTPRGRERILFVDDEAEIAELSQRILESFGYTVETHTDSVAALAAFERSPDAFDLVITNYTMPKICGGKLSTRIKTIRPSLPIMLVTGVPESELKTALEKYEFSSHLKKPLALRELGRKVREVLDSNQLIEV